MKPVLDVEMPQILLDPAPSVAAPASPTISAPPSTDSRLRVLLVCSSGGHLSQLYQLKPWWAKHDRTWVTFEKDQSVSMLEGEDIVWAHHPTTRNLMNAARNFRLAVQTLRELRPDVIVSTGAGVAFPFFVAASMLRVPTVFIEAYERVESASLTGRLCYPLSDLFLLQWDEQKRMYPRGQLLGHVA